MKGKQGGGKRGGCWAGIGDCRVLGGVAFEGGGELYVVDDHDDPDDAVDGAAGEGGEGEVEKVFFVEGVFLGAGEHEEGGGAQGQPKGLKDGLPIAETAKAAGEAGVATRCEPRGDDAVEENVAVGGGGEEEIADR